jgi:uncharacterized protein (TIGR01777 family)
MKILLAGGTGLIGTALRKEGISKGHTFIILSRNRSNANQDGTEMRHWDPATGQIDVSEEDTFDAVINLSGESIASGRWTNKRKKELLDSRVESTRLLVTTIQKFKSRPALLINASATGYYQSVQKGSITEESIAGSKFISQICIAWEREADKVSALGVRCIKPRIGIVLTPEGGALQKMLLPFSLGLGGRLGSGKQYMSWISLKDVVSSLLFCLEAKKIEGPINFTSPTPITNFQFTKVLGRVLKKPTIFPVPEIVLKVLLGEMADQLLLASLPVLPEKLLLSGFEFKDQDLEETLERMLDPDVA